LWAGGGREKGGRMRKEEGRRKRKERKAEAEIHGLVVAQKGTASW
jgi:hypothetical protein